MVLEDTEGWDQYHGWGRINVESALLAASDYAREFGVKDSTDELIAWFDTLGNLFLKGSLFTRTEIQGHWKFDDGSGTTAEDSVGNNHGELKNMDDNDWVPGKLGSALHFDGVNDYLSFDYRIDALKTSDVTVMAWIKAPDNWQTQKTYPVVAQRIYDWWNYNFFGYCLGVRTDAGHLPAFSIDNDSAISGDTIGADEWHHLAGTYDGEELKIYLDGQLKQANPLPDKSGYDCDPYVAYSDGHPQYVANYFDGIIDDVRVYKDAMSEAEIREFLSPDVTRFRIKDSSGDTVAWFDDSGNVLLKGSLHEGQESWQDPSDQSHNFIIKNPNDEVVAYIDDSGDLYLKGRLFEQYPYP